MKRIALLLLLVFLLQWCRADEGMWLPLLVGQQKYNEMLRLGLKLSKEQLYSLNKASLKDAVVIFGGGCTGALVSNQGLIFTNHHCGYDAIASASTVEHNYLKNGFYAMTKGDEIPAKGLSIQFLLKIEDVTKEVEESVKGLNGADRVQVLQAVLTQINQRFSDSARSIEARVSPLFKGNQFLVFVYQRYKDIRLVGAPPESVGKFGGDTDNWEWPRHTGDFSLFRVYADQNGQPADYSPNNIPLKPKYFLPVSVKGIRNGDYAMIYGYPGSTNRYETSYGVKLKTDIENPSIVKLRDVRLKLMFAEMQKDPAIRLKLASSYAGIANYWKFYDGEAKQLLKYDVYGQKKLQEQAFEQWAKGKPEFDSIFSEYAKAYEAWRPYAKHRIYLIEGVMGAPLAAFASTLQQVENALVKQGSTEADLKKALEAANKARAHFLAQENRSSDQNILAATCRMFYTDIDKNQYPIGFYEALRRQYGDLNDESTYKKWAASVFSQTMILDDAKWNAFLKNPDGVSLQNDPAYAYASAFVKNYTGKYAPLYTQFMIKNNDLGRMYLKGVMQMNPNKVRYPDATFTMRVSYGVVKSYRPRDAVFYDCVTTLKGVMEKYKPGDDEFDVPDKLIDLYRKKDFGQYKDPKYNDIVVGFITNNDITGGNSGSPVMNGKGELIGLAFDGNYEALSHKIAFDPVYNRTICVDIRYVLWCIDKLGGAPQLISELKLMRD